MLVSVNWLKELLKLDEIDTKELANKMSSAGLEVEDIKKLAYGDHLVIGQIKTCEEHPDSDHLHVLNVDVGSEVLQIVCGAANVAQDKLVVVAMNNTMMMDGSGIRPGSLRGIASNGMCCSKKELGLTKDPARVGIILLDETYKVGEDFDFKV